ncbi:hypothetical protein [Candidatus Nitrosotenuis sp. DW1]|uniref:hypothetical protein n=1 Tax=Candidatus Nitrosotenuis sp. DW1 TaxID=2259672 RepID=UPI0015CE9D94|nr:hypothetical protein [Candidatus Nitrosotenuis sp. DW1]QLH08749.1 hypothetical protein DSQ19_03975 [Candidatus Nitrosotenuis sp. DW1]
MITCSSCATINWKRLAIAIPITAIVNMFILYALFMNPISQNVIFSDSLGQSPKLVAVWTTLEPVPQITSLLPALLITPVIFSFFFAVLYDSIPGHGKIKKGFAYGIILWGTIAMFFELFTPLGLFGEPLYLLAYELALWFIGLVTVSLVISAIYIRK